MKKISLYRKPPLLLYGLSLILLVGCDILGLKTTSTIMPTGTSSGSLTFQGQTTVLSKLYSLYYELVDTGVHNIDLEIIPSTLNYYDASGLGRAVYVEMFFPTPTVSAGEYNFTSAYPPPAYSFSDYSCLYTNGYSSYEDLTGGTITISISGSTYTINGNVTAGGQAATFSYTGPIIAEAWQ